MKMENALRAERNGIITKVHFQQGASVEVDDVIMELD
jgi:biotin carboxyl carrier protein